MRALVMTYLLCYGALEIVCVLLSTMVVWQRQLNIYFCHTQIKIAGIIWKASHDKTGQSLFINICLVRK